MTFDRHLADIRQTSSRYSADIYGEFPADQTKGRDLGTGKDSGTGKDLGSGRNRDGTGNDENSSLGMSQSIVGVSLMIAPPTIIVHITFCTVLLFK